MQKYLNWTSLHENLLLDGQTTQEIFFAQYLTLIETTGCDWKFVFALVRCRDFSLYMQLILQSYNVWFVLDYYYYDYHYFLILIFFLPFAFCVLYYPGWCLQTSHPSVPQCRVRSSNGTKHLVKYSYTLWALICTPTEVGDLHLVCPA